MRQSQPLSAAAFLCISALLLLLAVWMPVSPPLSVPRPAGDPSQAGQPPASPVLSGPEAEEIPSWEILEEAAHWAVSSARDMEGAPHLYHYAVFDDGGAMLLEDTSPVCPSLSMVSEDVVMVCRSYGSPGRYVWFVRLSGGEVRGGYDSPVAWSDSRVAYLAPPEDGSGGCLLYVESLWGAEAPLAYDLPFSQATATPSGLVDSAAFRGDTLTLEFINQENQLESRTLDLTGPFTL